MSNGLKYLKRESENDLHFQTRLLILKELSLLKKENGKFCEKCKVYQGYSYKGFDKYYCKCCRNKIENKLKKENKKITKLLINFTQLSIDANLRVEV